MNQSQDTIALLFDLEKEESLCHSIALPQERLLFRAHRRARCLAIHLLSGQEEKELIDQTLSLIKNFGHIVDADVFDTGMVWEHQLKMLHTLCNEPAFLKAIKKVELPVCHQAAEGLIRQTLELSSTEKLTSLHIRQAVLSACLAPLRQQVGSCFASAPAILIQREQPLQLVEDLHQLLITGKLKRIFGGIEFAVPLSPNSGLEIGNQLLKSWEYTLASFSEVKMEFSTWNLYSSLGFHPEEKGGVGEVLYRIVQEELDLANQKTATCQIEYEHAFHQVKTAEVLLRQAATEAEIRRYRAEHQSRLYHMRSCLELRDEAHARAEAYASFPPFMLKQYERHFPGYFQEIYDAKIQDSTVRSSQEIYYDDQPAGFRLVYKHGRSDPSVWSLIYTADQYISSLVSFFLAVEQEIILVCEWEEGKRKISALTSALVAHLRAPEFLHTALQRCVRAHALVGKAQLGLLGQKKPWAYISGGTLYTLLKTYYKRESDITVEEKQVESPLDLLVFILDTMKALPHSTETLFLKDPQKGLLMSSPTHAFVLHPGWSVLKDGWQDSGFTYTWVRDRVLIPGQQFYTSLQLLPSQQQFLVKEFIKQYKLDVTPPPLPEHALSPSQLRNLVVQKLFHPSQVSGGRDAFDGFLYQTLPLVERASLKSSLRLLLKGISNELIEKAIEDFSHFPEPFVTAERLKAFATHCVVQVHGRHLSFDLSMYLSKQAALSKLSPPLPVSFADTNWGGYQFAFLINPGTEELELWRVDRTASHGLPMSMWSHSFDGSKNALWSLCIRPHEYTANSLSPHAPSHLRI